jgi:putative Holliday junction resolvase
MGIDFGHKNVGIAVTDDAGVMAFPHSVLKNDSALLKAVTKLVEERKVEEIVIGHSLDYAGKANKIHTLVEEFITDLTLALGIPIHLEPEQYSTQQALRIQGRNPQTDAAAAAIILESYLSKQNKTSVFTKLND